MNIKNHQERLAQSGDRFSDQRRGKDKGLELRSDSKIATKPLEKTAKKKQRLAQALRSNLARRKEQARQRHQQVDHKQEGEEIELDSVQEGKPV